MSISVEHIAAMCHRVNKAICEAAGDQSQPTWENAPDWQKTSCIDGVLNALLNSPQSPEQNHKNWVDFKLADGWVRGDIKDPVRKTHPCLVPFVDLPLEQKIKDYVFLAVVEGMASLLPEVTVDTVASTPATPESDADQRNPGMQDVNERTRTLTIMHGEGVLQAPSTADVHPVEEGAPVSVGSDFVDETQRN